MSCLSLVWNIPGGKDSEHVQISGRECVITARELLCDTVHFRFDQKLKNHGLVSTLRTFEPSAPRLQHPGSSSAKT